jgi:hypothetical protein
LENLAPFEDETSEASTAETEIEKGKDFWVVIEKWQ